MPTWSEVLQQQTAARLQEFSAGFTSPRNAKELEQLLRSTQRWIGRLLLEAMASALEAWDDRLARPTCPVCQRRLHTNRKETLTLQMLEGEVEIRRAYVECREHKFYCHPLDAALGLMASGECTPSFGHDLCLLAAELPTPASVRVLQALTGRVLSDGTIKAEVERAGAALVELERLEAEALWPYDAAGRRRETSVGGLAQLHAPPEPTGTLIVSMDGVMVNLGNEQDIRAELRRYDEHVKELQGRGQTPKGTAPSMFREARVLRIYRQADVVEKTTKSGKVRRTITRSETVVVVNDPVFFERRVNALMRIWQAEKYPVRVLIMDGAPVLWEVGISNVDPTIQILDLRHAQSHIYECGHALFGRDTIEARRWGRTWASSVKKKGPSALLAELDQLSGQSWSPEGATTLKNLRAYVVEHCARMNYPAFLKMGLPIGSGVIESANRQVVVDRCKRSGMRWCRRGLQHVVSFRAALLSGNWNRACNAIDQYRSYARRLELLRDQRAAEAAPAAPAERQKSASKATDKRSARPFRLASRRSVRGFRRLAARAA